MKKKFLAGFATGLFLVGMVGLANATLITDPTQLTDPSVDINFDTTFPASIPNVTITGISAGYINSAGYSAPITYPSYVSGNTYRVDPGTLAINFSTPVFEVGFGLWDPSFQGTGFEVFDINGISLTGGFVQAPTGLTGGSFATYLGVHETSNVISQVIITAANGDLVGLDNISFSSAAPVPEPATMLLFGTGLAGLVGTRIRRKKK